VTAAFNDGAKLVTRIRDDRADSDRSLPEDPTRDLLDSLQLGPLLVKGQYDRDLKRFGEPVACGDAKAREQMKDVLINLQMALIISLRGVSMDDGDIDFEALQQTSDDCRTNAGVCLGQLSQRLSDTAKAQAMISETEVTLLPEPQQPKHASLAYSSSRSTRSTRSSGRDPRTPPDSIHEEFASMSVVSSNAGTIRAMPERKRANSSASKRGYQPRRPMTPQSQASYGVPMISIPQNDDGRHRLRNMPSHDILTPPDDEALHGFRNGYTSSRHPSHESVVGPRGSSGNLSDSSHHSRSYVGRRQAGYLGGVPSTTSSHSNSSRNGRQAPSSASNRHVSQEPARAPSRARFGGIPSDPVPLGARSGPTDEYDMSTLDDPTTSEEDEEDILSLRRPSSHALGPDEAEIYHARAESPAQSYVVSLPDADPTAPVSPVSTISEGDHSEDDSIMPSPEVLHSRRFDPRSYQKPAPAFEPQYRMDDSTPVMSAGDFGYATVYETSRIKPAESMPEYKAVPRARQPRQDSLSRLRESRLISHGPGMMQNGRNTPVRTQEELQSTIKAAEARVRHYRNRPSPVQEAEQQRPSRMEHVAYMQQNIPKHLADLPLPPPPSLDQRPDSRNSAKSRPAQAYKVFPSASPHGRTAPRPPPSMAPPPPPLAAPRWNESARPAASPTRREELHPLQPTDSYPPASSEPEALPQNGPGPAEETSLPELKPEVSRPMTAKTTATTATNSSGSQRMVKIVPLDMALYGATYTRPPKPKKVKPEAPPMPLTMPLILPTDKALQGFCKGAYKTFNGEKRGSISVHSRPVGISGNMSMMQCAKCQFSGPVKTVSVEGKKGKKKEEKIADPGPRDSPVKGLDGQTGGVRYKWMFLAKCHTQFKMRDELALMQGAGLRGELGGFGCIFCCAEGNARGWIGLDGAASIKSGSTGSANTTKTTDSGGKHDTPIFKDLERFMNHLEMHRREDGWPGAEMLGRTKCVVGRKASDAEEWEINFLPVRGEKPADAEEDKTSS
jgi:hypothetical protein